MDRESLWWNYVAGAARYVNDTLTAATGHRALLLEEIPFMSYYLRLIQEKLLQWDSSLQFEVSEADQWIGGDDIGEMLMNQYAPSNEYHPLDGPRAGYIAKHNLIQGRVLIVRRIERRSEWLPLAIEYARNSGTQNGLLVLTFTGSCPLATARKGLAMPQWNTYITNYDMQLFASYCISGKANLQLSLRHYITQIASRMAGKDPELCSVLAVEELAYSPVTVLRKHAGTYEIAARLADDLKAVESVLWEAQIQTVYPIVEQMRRRFIEEYTTELRNVLPQRDEFGKYLLTPEDMELRHMWYYFFKVSGFSNSADGHTFKMIYDARNNLAHLVPLDNATVISILALEA
ncbi:hypothetical protein [Cohnella boryungensis]|uniref:Swt1-like HEPN domain-containing protein n=1 Tax=Cohnella boryungensis TaxID=768479 RepID=A0ABV8SF62_9BACL